MVKHRISSEKLSPAKAQGTRFDREGSYMFEILLEPLFIQIRKERVFRPIPRYPYIERDLSFIVEEKVSGDMIKHLISRLGHDIIASVILFDLYRGESIPEGYQSMAFRIRYQSEDRTLTDEEVQEVHSRVADTLCKEIGRHNEGMRTEEAARLYWPVRRTRSVLRGTGLDPIGLDSHVRGGRVMTIAIPEKQYFKIGEVSEILDVEPYVLRYWESEFKILKPTRTRARQRLVSQEGPGTSAGDQTSPL